MGTATCGGPEQGEYADWQSTETDEDAVRSSEQAVETPQQTVSVALEVPTDVTLGDVAVVAGTSLTMNDRVSLTQTAVSDRLGLTVGLDAKVGPLRGGRIITLKDRAKVTGNVKAGLTISKGPGVVITGTSTQNAPVTLKTTTISANAPQESLGPVTIDVGQRRLLTPGTYGALTVNSGGKLTLETGVYVFQSAIFQASSELRIADTTGPVQVFVKTAFTYRGKVVATGPSVPKWLVGYLGTTTAIIEAPFTGGFLAPNADARFQAALPVGHRAFIYGKNVTLDADTKIEPYPMPWFELLGPTQYTPLPADTPKVTLPSSPVTIHLGPADFPSHSSGAGGNGGTGGVGGSSGGGDSGGAGGSASGGADVGGGSIGGASSAGSSGTGGSGGAGTTFATVTQELTTPLKFSLPTSYPLAGGTIGNGVVTFTFQNGAANPIICTYKGGSSTSTPTTQTELNLGRTLTFVSCSDGQPISTRRIATKFTLSAPDLPGYPYSLTAPISKDGACSEQFELLTPSQMDSMRSGFNWAQKTKVPALDSKGRPTLFYSWIYVRNLKDVLSLKKLKIHVLTRPLFTSEYAQFDDRCGSFVNPGDGTGTFVPALIAGAGYNKLIDAFNEPSITGDKTVFQAVILRDPPAEVRTPQGSIDIEKLAKTGFRYLDYMADPFQNPDEIQADLGDWANAITDALNWVVTAFDDAGKWLANAFGDLDKEIRGRQSVRFHFHLFTRDPDFGGRGPNGGSLAVRGWGPLAGTPLGAPGVQVGVLQWWSDTPIPADTHGRTDMTGMAALDIAKYSGLRTEGNGSGVCIDHETDAAMVTDFLVKSSNCDFRAWNPDTGVLGETTFQIRRLAEKPDNQLIIDHPRINRLYQADDAFQYSKQVLQFTPQRARMLVGFHANTFSQAGRAYTPCLGVNNSFSDEATFGVAVNSAVVVGGSLAWLGGGGIIAGAVVGTVVALYASVILSTDIVFPDGDEGSRHVATHEYGHYLFCSMLAETDNNATGYLVRSMIFVGDDQRKPYRWVNEAVADWFTGQIVGGADYGWLAGSGAPGVTAGQYCVPPSGSSPNPWCWDTNVNTVSTAIKGNESIGRAATLLHDLFDGAGATRGTPDPSSLLPNDGDAWRWTNPTDTSLPLVLNTTSYNNTDSSFDRVALPGPSGMAAFTRIMATGLQEVDFDPNGVEGDFSEKKFYAAVIGAMSEHNVSWCDQCRVVALHTPGITDPMNMPIHDVFEACKSSDILSELFWVPPFPLAKLTADCGSCPAGEVAQPDGTCAPDCPADVVLNAASLGVGQTNVSTGASVSGDTCPETFVLRIENHGALYGGLEPTTVSLEPTPASATSCPGSYTLEQVLTKGGSSTTASDIGTGTWEPCNGFTCPSEGGNCTGTAEFSIIAADADVAVYRTVRDASRSVVINVPSIFK